MFDFALLSSVEKFLVSPHRDGEGVTISFDLPNGDRVQAVTELKKLPAELRAEGTYVRRGGAWRRVLRVDGTAAVDILKALLGEA